tara:strand:- start:1296 stop:2033 length:738 start_codon:yes stop_codon:yes gene_type:complete
MLNSRHKKAGFFGTLLFHLGLLLICFFSSIGYTSVELPIGIEIEFIPYQEFEEVEDISKQEDYSESNESTINSDDLVEEFILQEDESVIIPNNEDTLTVSEEIKQDESVGISIELQNALSKISEMNFNETVSVTDQNENDLEVSMNSNTIIKDSQDGYTLSDNRFAVRKVKPEYSCEEFGKVIVRVWVNKEGFTIKAEAGIRGTTESSPCLLKEAKNAAMKTTWTPYFNAPEVQIGHITYNFHKY